MHSDRRKKDSTERLLTVHDLRARAPARLPASRRPAPRPRRPLAGSSS
jgi:hypothetical protein